MTMIGLGAMGTTSTIIDQMSGVLNTTTFDRELKNYRFMVMLTTIISI